MSIQRGLMRSHLVGLGVVASALLAGASYAQELRYAVGAPPEAPAVGAVEAYADAVEHYTDGEVSLQIFAMTLLEHDGKSDGIRDGLADMGWVLTPYFPASYPHINFISETSMLLGPYDGDMTNKEGLVFGAAVAEFIFHHCPECLDELEAQNQVYTGHSAGTPYELMCSEPVRDLEEFDGTRVRVGSSNHSRWSDELGGSSVTMSANEMYEALSHGAVDCIALSTPEILNYSLGELITDLTVGVPGGVFPFSPFQINRDTWQGLTEDQREGMLRASAVGAAEVAFTYHDNAEKAMEHVQEEGAEIHDADEQFVEATESFVDDDMQALYEQYRDDYGLDRGEEMLETFEELLAKWEDLVSDVDDRDDFSELYWEEIVSRIDVESYGMEWRKPRSTGVLLLRCSVVRLRRHILSRVTVTHQIP